MLTASVVAFVLSSAYDMVVGDQLAAVSDAAAVDGDPMPARHRACSRFVLLLGRIRGRRSPPFKSPVSGPRKGCRVHVCFGDEQHLRVSEIWDSPEQLEAFGEKLRPHLESAGVQLSGEQEVFPVHLVETF